jgi:hypothetical protein
MLDLRVRPGLDLRMKRSPSNASEACPTMKENDSKGQSERLVAAISDAFGWSQSLVLAMLYFG